MADEFSDKLIAFAKRNINSAERCTNEESTKMFLVLPFVNFLGYDDRNPHEVCPEHAADFFLTSIKTASITRYCRTIIQLSRSNASVVVSA